MSKLRNIYIIMLQRFFTFGIIILLFPAVTFAQIYPVQVVTEIVPPYSVYLSDYTTPGSGKFAVNLLLTDVSRYNYPVKLRLVIEGEGISVTTSASYMPTQIILDGGSPLRLTGDELADYFNPNNLDFKGYSKQKHIQTGSLPEGIYRIGFQVLDYNKSIPVSLTGSATAWLVLNDPPMFNIPEKDIKLTATEPQNIMFQWMPRHLGSPNSSFNAEYILQIYEIWPEDRNPNEVVAATQPLIEKTTISTSYIYSNTTEAALIPGRQYAYRVQAKDIEDRDLFRNKGYSEVQKFTYGDPCNPPTQIAAQSNNAGMITINWEASEYNTAYLVQYREAGNNGMWYPKTSYINSATIDKLKPQTKYEYKVQGQCATVNSDYSEVMSVTTQAKKPAQVVCGTNDAATPLKSTLPLTSLLPGDIITSGQFEVQVTKATGGNGKWTGEGFMHVPFMGVKVRMTFTDISINDKFQVTRGRIVSIYNPNSKFVAQVGGNKQNKTNTPVQPQTGNQDKDTSANVITVTSPIDTIVKASNGDILIVSQNGDTTTIHTNADGTKVAISATGDSTVLGVVETVAVVDADGNTSMVDSNGNITPNLDERKPKITELFHFTINNDTTKFFNSQEFYVISQDSVLKVHVKSNSVVFGEDSVSWSINGKFSANKKLTCEVKIQNKGKQEIIANIGSKIKIILNVKIYEKPIVDFKVKTYDSSFGFDKKEYDQIACTYSKHKVNGKDSFIPYISVPVAQTKTIMVDFDLPSETKKDKNFFVRISTTSNIILLTGIKPRYLLSDLSSNVALNIQSNHTVGADTILITDNTNSVIGKAIVFVNRNVQNLNLKLIYVKTPSKRNISVNEIANQLNFKSYNQAFIHWNIDSVLWDISKHNKWINHDVYFKTNAMALNTLKNIYERDSLQTAVGNNYVAFITDMEYKDGEEGSYAGRADDIGGHYVIIFKSADKITMTHELGHCLGLYHLDQLSLQNNAGCVINNMDQKTTKNFISYASSRVMFWHWQWLIMNPLF